GLVGTGGAHAFVLVVDLDGALQGLFEIEGPPQRRGAVQEVLLQDLVGDRDQALGAHLLLDDVHGTDGGQVLRADRLSGARVKGRIHGRRQVGQDIVPLPGNLRIVQQDLSFFHFSVLLQFVYLVRSFFSYKDPFLDFPL